MLVRCPGDTAQHSTTHSAQHTGMSSQMKQLTHNERVRYALLVVAMASRDGPLLRATLAELGVRIENCNDSFAEVRRAGPPHALGS